MGTPPDTGLGKLCMRSPLTPEQDNDQKIENRCPGRVYRGHSRHLRQGWASNREACGNPSPKSRVEGGDRGAENREKMGEAAGGGQAGSMVFLPSSSGGVGSRVGGGPGGGGQTQPGLLEALLASLDNDSPSYPPAYFYQGHSCAQGPASVAGLQGVCSPVTLGLTWA